MRLWVLLAAVVLAMGCAARQPVAVSDETAKTGGELRVTAEGSEHVLLQSRRFR